MSGSEFIPHVGDLVRLNAHGLRTIHGLKTPEEVCAYRDGSRVVSVEPIDTVPPLFAVEIDGPLGRMILNHTDVEAMA